MSETKKPEMSLQQFVQSDNLRGEIVKVLPKHITAERFARIAWTAIVRNPALSTCERNSLATAIILCAQAGLEPDGRLAHLVPFGNRVQVIWDWKGLVTLAKRNGVDCKAILVFSSEVRSGAFEYIPDDGTGKTIVRHRVDPFLKDRGELVGVYSRAVEKGKDPDYELMTIDEVEGIRERSRAKDNGPWKTDYGEMVKKTVIKRHSKRWDLLPEIRDVINAEDDTPPPINVPTVSRPIFDKPQVEAPNGNAEPAKPDEVPASFGKAMQEVAQWEESVKANPPQRVEVQGNGFNPVKAVRGLCKEAKIKESILLGFCHEIGLATEPYESFEHLQLTQPEVLKLVSEQWSDVSKRILEATKGGQQ